MVRSFGRPRQQADGSILYQKKGIEPPPDLDGFKRDPKNHWRFLPMWSACKYRFQNQHMKACGAISILSICQHPDGPKENRQEVDFKICSTCPLSKI